MQIDSLDSSQIHKIAAVSDSGEGLTEYADLAETEMKKAVKKTATSVKKEISANAPKKTGAYAKSWTAKKTKENGHSLEMTVHSKNKYQLAHLLEKGHAKRGGGRVAGKPHISPAEENGVQMLENLIREALECVEKLIMYMPTQLLSVYRNHQHISLSCA